MSVGVQQQQRRDSESNWVTSGKILAAGEIGFATDSKIIKLGDGVNTWENLDIPYDGRYLPIGGKAADSEMLDGISSGGFLLVGDASTTATADKVIKRDGAGRGKVVAGATGEDIVNYDQLYTVSKENLISRTVTAAFTLALTDNGKTILANNSSSTYTTFAANIPANSSVPFPVGSTVKIVTIGKGPITLTPLGAASLTGPTAIPGGVSSVTVTKTATDAWVVIDVNYSPGPVLRRKIKTGSDNTLAVGFTKLRLDGSDSGTALFSNNADTLGANEQWSSADNFKCYCRRAGWYDVTAQITVAQGIAGRIYVKLYINNILQNFGQGTAKNSQLDIGSSVTANVPLNVGDYVEVYGFQEVGGTVTISETTDSHSAFEWAWRRPL